MSSPVDKSPNSMATTKPAGGGAAEAKDEPAAPKSPGSDSSASSGAAGAPSRRSQFTRQSSTGVSSTPSRGRLERQLSREGSIVQRRRLSCRRMSSFDMPHSNSMASAPDFKRLDAMDTKQGKEPWGWGGEGLRVGGRVGGWGWEGAWLWGQVDLVCILITRLKVARGERNILCRLPPYHQVYTLITRFTPSSPGLHPHRQVYTLIARFTPSSPGLHPLHQVYTLITRFTPVSPGLHPYHQVYTIITRLRF